MIFQSHLAKPLLALTIAAMSIVAAVAAPLVATQHWEHMPVRVYFDPGEAATPRRVMAAVSGFAEWSAASGGVLWYSVVDRAVDSDVVVHFVAAKSVTSDTNRVGETETQSRSGVITRASIRLATADTSENQLQEEAAHEWGHALGISGHSTDPKDLMYPTTTRIFDVDTGKFRPTSMRRVSAEDLRAIKDAYPSLFRAADRDR